LLPKVLIGKSREIGYESPSNIALVKYWGKYGRQYPRNTSLSFTLSKAKSITYCKYQFSDKKSPNLDLSFYFEGKRNQQFEDRIRKFLLSIQDEFEWIPFTQFDINSKNTFPHSSGIASSASALSALALCLIDIHFHIQKVSDSDTKNDNENDNLGEPLVEDKKLQKASFIARLGSGSASRSIFPKLALWGVHPDFALSSNDYAIPFYEHFDTIFHDYQDDILIVSKREKSVSSSAGHKLMEDNPYAAVRYQQANQNISVLVKAMKEGDLNKFIQIVESEAMTLHALMMCSSPSYILMEPNTIEIINRIRQFRVSTKVPICFTLDAGPNVHILYPKSYKSEANAFIMKELIPLSEGGLIIEDEVGMGPKKMQNIS